MEKNLKLKTKDGHIIYGTLNIGKRKSSKLIVFVHGLTGHQNEHQFYNAARFFPKHGFDTFRFDLYSAEKGGRTLTKCTIKTHAEDLNRVLGYFRKTYKKIAAVGHSLGGPTIVYSDINLIDVIVFWDATDMINLNDVMEGLERKMRFVKSLNAYVFDWGVEILLGKRMAAGFENFDPAVFATHINKPTKVICAQKGNVRGGKKYMKYLKKPKQLHIIEGAGHTYDEEGVEEKLFQETLKWIKRFVK